MPSQMIQIRSKDGQDLLSEYSWRLLETSETHHQIPWQSLDVVFEKAEPASASPLNKQLDQLEHGVDYAIYFGQEEISDTKNSLGSIKAVRFLLSCLQSAETSRTITKFIIPLQKGNIVHSDILSTRLRDSPTVKEAVSFSEPLQSYPGSAIKSAELDSLTTIFRSAAAGYILVHSDDNPSDSILQATSIAAESELQLKISLPWILPDVQQHTLVLVEGSRVPPTQGGVSASVYGAVQALGLKVVVLDNPGHWMEGPEYAAWRESFIPTPLADPPAADFADQIVKSVKTYGHPVDGIITFCDSYMVAVAEAAQRLGLPTSAPEALRTATDKYLTSKFAGHQAYQASSPEEALEIANTQQLPYPLIIKPCNGWSSEGVFRVDSKDELTAAVKSIDTTRHGSEFVIEKYCAGPEVDANFVMLDGEILFYEICDDFPKAADSNGPSVGTLNSFIELNSVYPSALPAAETDTMRDDFSNLLLKLGLHNGIMHLEGRVEDSSVDYETKDGVFDLHPRDAQETAGPTPWLIEINPRPLGMAGTKIIESTYGVDYWALAMLIAVRDGPRARALAQPFKGGAQYTCVMVFIPTDYSVSCEGIFDSDDICAELKARRPDLAKHISQCGCIKKRGDKVPHPSTGVNSFLAWFNVFSRQGRTEALRLANEVREQVRFSFK